MKFLFSRIKKDMILNALIVLVLGAILLFYPTAATALVCYVLGALLLVYGGITMHQYLNDPYRSAARLAASLTLIVLGAFVLFRYRTVVSIIPFLMGIFFLFCGIRETTCALSLKDAGYSGWQVNLTLAQANYLNGIGVDTALNFMSGWGAWGNYTACYPSNTDVKDYFIPVSRMFGWVGNSLVKTFWSKLDKPMTRRLIDTVLDSANIWLNGLVGMGYLLGARVEMLENENPLTNLMAGIIKLHVYMTPPSPAQEIDFVLEYDASYVTSALQG